MTAEILEKWYWTDDTVLVKRGWKSEGGRGR